METQKKFSTSLANAFSGLKVIWQTENNFRIQTVIAVITLTLAGAFRFSYAEWVAIVFAIALVLSAEGWNTILEKTLDKVQPRPDPAVGRIKDMMAASVLLASLGALVVGLLTFWHHFFLI